MPVAVLGAGFQGVCAALALASRAIDGDLYDRNDAVITQAGLVNEGKIHLGFTYANDRTGKTAQLMAQGALAFQQALASWLDCSADDLGLSGPHHYAVHRDSQLSTEAILMHFDRVRGMVRAMGAQQQCSYLGVPPDSVGYERLDVEPTYDPELIVANIRTDERSVDVARVAGLLRRRVADETRITFHPHSEVAAASRDGQHITIQLVKDGQVEQRRYLQVVNCLWDGQLAIDQQMGCLPPHRWLHRLKYGAFLTLREPLGLPSTTFVLGPFGDIVLTETRRLYMSWYPVARGGISTALVPPPWPRQLPPVEAEAMVERMLDGLAALMPPLRALSLDDVLEISLRGGIIVAQGETDIDDPHSGLHQRTAVGIRSHNGYHTVDTGKYTLAPMLALALADRISEEMSRWPQ